MQMACPPARAPAPRETPRCVCSDDWVLGQEWVLTVQLCFLSIERMCYKFSPPRAREPLYPHPGRVRRSMSAPTTFALTPCSMSPLVRGFRFSQKEMFYLFLCRNRDGGENNRGKRPGKKRIISTAPAPQLLSPFVTRKVLIKPFDPKRHGSRAAEYSALELER